MDSVRKILGGLFTLLGAYYCVIGSFTLVRLPTVTTHWVQQSGDPDFKYDYGFFLVVTALGATLVAVLGWRTMMKGIAAVRGRRSSWLGLALAALPLQWFWFLHRVIGTGLLDRERQHVAQQSAAIQFGGVYIGYVCMWVVMRRVTPDRPADISLKPTLAGDTGSDR